MADDYTADDFRGAVDGTFDIESDGETLGLVLERVQDLPPGVRESGSFRLHFRGPREPVVPQGLYRFTRGADAYDIFIVPIAQNDKGTAYEAIFN